MNSPTNRTRVAPDPTAAYKSIKWLIWTYFALLIYEGALRKWIFPGFANPLLIIRDPVVILIYMQALSLGLFPDNRLVTYTTGLGILSFFVSLVAGSGNILVSIYGWRTDFLHIPLIFLIPKILTAEDVKKMCKWLLITSLPMAVLVMYQWKAGPGAWINAGVGGTEGGQLDVGFGKIRPPGTFSFTNGLANYLALVAAFLLYAVIDRKYYPRWLLFSAVPATVLMIVISGSRATVSAVVISVFFLTLICLRRPAYLGGSFPFFILALPGLLLITSFPIFQEGIMVHTARFGEAGGGVQHGIIDRTLGDYLEGFYAIPDTPFFGYGLGLGTNAAAGMLAGGERTFLLAESEWPRVVKEGGPVLGLAFLFLRVGIAIYLGLSALAALRRENPLAVLLFSSSFLLVMNGQFGQPTALGFAVFGAGLCLAAANEATDAESVMPIQQEIRRRGRSVYAEMLHGN